MRLGYSQDKFIPSGHRLPHDHGKNRTRPALIPAILDEPGP